MVASLHSPSFSFVLSAPPPRVTSLRKAHPSLCSQYHPKKNSKNSRSTPSDSLLPLWWKCRLGPDHEWQSTVQDRLRAAEEGRNDCPCCANVKHSVTNSLAVTHPRVAALWHPTKNSSKKSPSNLLSTSRSTIWFLCPAGPDHEWRSPLPVALSAGLSCPCCLNKKLSATNSLSAVRPDIAGLWHRGKNGSRTPESVLAASDGDVWLKRLEDGREWTVNLREASGAAGLPSPPPPPPPLSEVVAAVEELKSAVEERVEGEERERERERKREGGEEAEKQAEKRAEKNNKGWRSSLTAGVLSALRRPSVFGRRKKGGEEKEK